MAKSRTRISLHTSDKKPSVGEEVTFSGYLQVYDGRLKRWDPLKGKLMLFVDGIKIREFSSDNYGCFEVKHTFRIPKRYDVEIRYDGSAKTKACMAGMRIEVLTKEQKNRIRKIIRIFTSLMFLLLISIFVIFLLHSF